MSRNNHCPGVFALARQLKLALGCGKTSTESARMSELRQIAASPAAIRRASSDPDMLIKLRAGRRPKVHGSPRNGFEATVVQKVGPRQATFKGTVT